MIRSRYVKNGSIILLSFLLLLSGITLASSVTTTYYVDPVNGDDSNSGSEGLPFKTITHAVDVAISGETINLASGTYSEATGEIFPIGISEDLTIIGNDSIIDSSDSSHDHNTLEVNDCSISLSDMTITGASGYSNCYNGIIRGCGVYSYNSSFTLNSVSCNNNASHGFYYSADNYAGTIAATDYAAEGNGKAGLQTRVFGGGSVDIDIDGAYCSGNFKGLSFFGGYEYGSSYWYYYGGNTNGSGALDITISDAVCVENSQGFFVASHDSDTKLSVTDSNFSDNTRHGFISHLYYGTTDISIEDSIFEVNSRHGINVYAGDCDTFNLEVDGCIVQNNQHHGMRIDADDCASSTSITNTTVSGNGHNGCYFDIDDAKTNISIDASTFTGNGYNGLYIDDDDSETILTVDSSACNENVKNGLVVKSDECHGAVYTVADSEAKGNGNNGLLYVGYDKSDANLVLDNNEFSGNGVLVVAPVFSDIDNAPAENLGNSCSNPHSKSGSCMDNDTDSSAALDGKSMPHVSKAGAYITSIEDSFLGILFKDNVFTGNAGPGCAFNTGFDNEDGDEAAPGEILDLGLYYVANALFGNGAGDTFVDEGCGTCTLNRSDASIASMQPIATLFLAKANAQFAMAQSQLPSQPTGDMAALLDSINELMSGAHLSANYIFASGQAYQALELIAQLHAMLA